MLSRITGEPPKPKCTVPLAVMVGATCTVSKVLVAVFAVAVPSFTVQSIVRLVSLPPPVGSPFDGLKLYGHYSSAVWLIANAGDRG